MTWRLEARNEDGDVIAWEEHHGHLSPGDTVTAANVEVSFTDGESVFAVFPKLTDPVVEDQVAWFTVGPMQSR